MSERVLEDEAYSKPADDVAALRALLRLQTPWFVTPGGLKHWPAVDRLNACVATVEAARDRLRDDLDIAQANIETMAREHYKQAEELLAARSPSRTEREEG